MRLAHAIALAAAVNAAAISAASAQFPSSGGQAQTPPGWQPVPSQTQSAFPGAQGQSGPPGGQQACAAKFIPLRSAAEKADAALRAATGAGKKPSAAEACRLLSALHAAMGKMAKFMETNTVWCGFSPQAATQLTGQRTQLAQIRKRACDVAKAQASGGGGAPPPPSLSDALGTTRVPDATTTTTKSGGGAFDTLTGNPLAR